jgi:hypothetical protein
MLNPGEKGARKLLRLTDRELQEGYAFTAGTAIGEGDAFTCASCDNRYAAPGTPRNVLTRVANLASRRPASIELCEFCIKRVFPRLK